MKRPISILTLCLTASLVAEVSEDKRSVISVNHGAFVTHSINPVVNREFLEFLAEEGVLAHYQDILQEAEFDEETTAAALEILRDGHCRMQSDFLDALWRKAVGEEAAEGGMERARKAYRGMRDELEKTLGDEKLREFSQVECRKGMRHYLDGLLKGREKPLSEEDRDKLLELLMEYLSDGVSPIEDQESAERAMMKVLRPGVPADLADHFEKKFEQDRYGFNVMVPVSFAPNQHTRSGKENLLKSGDQ